MNTLSKANTERSDALVERFRQQPLKAQRKVIEMRQTFPVSADQVFVLLCPSREADWIPSWDCDLVFTGSGYAEEHCVFRTDETNSAGPGVWVMSHHEPPRLPEIVRFLPAMVVNLKIALSDNLDGTTDGVWTVVFTGLDEEGNARIEQIPADAYENALKTLVHYLETGEMIEAPAYPAAHAHRFGKAHQGLVDRVRDHFSR